MSKRLLIILMLLYACFAMFVNNVWCKNNVPLRRPLFSAAKLVYDYSDLMPAQEKERVEGYLKHIFDDYDIEFIALTTPSLGNYTVSEWANMIFEDWRVGKNTRGDKGILLVVAPKEKRVRLEVGKDLEGLFTDAFVGYIEREQMKPFFEQNRVGVGIEATIELIISRIEKAIKQGRYSPTEGMKQKGGYHSTGAGAQKRIDIGSAKAPEKDIAPDNIKAYFCAQPTPQLTLSRYLEASRRHIKDPNLGIYTDETKAFFRHWTVTNAQQDNERQFDGVPFKIRIKGNYAVIYYPDKDWTYNPFFLKKSARGWQLDFATMSKVIRFNYNNYWHFVSFNHPYMFAFKQYQIDSGGFVWFKRTKSKRGYLNILFPWGKVPMEIKVVMPGSSAEKAGIRPGDVITHINGKDVREIGFAAAVNEAVGPIGTTLDLTVYRPSTGRSYTFTIERTEEIK